ncbi:beta-lactamase [Marinomonas ushuaiensis DSM 15871]|uniref:Beta-lactamase n=1 Tax=Marinomonas ushuaiensis DSM 15871 TaxID=1122207 RepID=X7E2X8_9GAMM|nr:TIGR01244 family sulfur transferase [Marinomonas ushuaiensis]ETX10384.1 beta-lactamase [Marinomonas ushuaiensis DSM 15871]
MSHPIQLDEFYFVAPQLSKEDFSALKEQGFERIINNRPELESEDQPPGKSLQEAAEVLGLEYISNPIDLSKLSQEHVFFQDAALSTMKKTLAFCRTGTRSSVLWVLINNSRGGSYDDLSAHVSSKGFDLTRCVSAMTPLLKK